MKQVRINKQDDKNKEEIIDRFCEHLKSGLSEYSFVECDYRDIENFAIELDKRNNKASQVEKIKKAVRESFCYWEKLAFDILKDGKKKFFFPLWIFYVKHRFHWGIEDKKKKETDKKEIEVNLSLDNDVKEIEK